MVYTITVANLGDIPDTFDLMVECDGGWNLELGATSMIVPAHQKRAVSLSVTVPKNVSLGAEVKIRVTATSRMDPVASSSSICIVGAEAMGKAPENIAENVAQRKKF